VTFVSSEAKGFNCYLRGFSGSVVMRRDALSSTARLHLSSCFQKAAVRADSLNNERLCLGDTSFAITQK